LAPPKEIAPKAKQAAETALKLDASLCEPYCSLGFYYTIFEWNWKEAEKNFLRSIELNPSYAQAHYWYGLNFFSWVKNDFHNGEKQGRIALELEPFSAICFGTYGAILHAFGKYEEALAACKTGIGMDANTFICHLFTGWSYMGLKQYEEAIHSFTQLLRFSNRHHFAINGLVLTYCMMGKFDEARTWLDELKRRSANEYIGWTVTALSMAYLGELDTAIEYLERAYNDREAAILTIKHQLPVPTTLRQDPRFQQLLDKIGYP
jgi:tetratricopeptide (TPR) repeat protein